MSVTSASPQSSIGNTLGIEGGGTRTTVLMANERDDTIFSFTAGPANLRLMTAEDLDAHLRGIRNRLPERPHRIGIGLAGARLEADFDRLRQSVARVWPGVPCAATDDLETALGAIEWEADCPVQVLVLSGTGSCTLGRRRNAETGEIDCVKIGGRGHILGDRASACDIAQHALRALMTIYDEDAEWPELGADILTHLQLNDPEDLIEWSLVADKTELAGVAVPIFRAAQRRRDEIAVAVLKRAAERLAKDAVTCASHIMESDDERVQFVFNGAVLLKNPTFADGVSARLRENIPEAVVTPLERPSVWGAVALARTAAVVTHPGTDLGAEESSSVSLASKPLSVASSPTEQRHPRSENFSELPIAAAIELMLDEDATVPRAILDEKAAIEWTVEKIVAAFAAGGRLIYAGAGTSGRLGVLDASECPPTFRASPDQVQGIIAGGRTALWTAVEGAEDDAEEGRRAIEHRDVGAKDVVVGISASGHAPFVWGCLEEARKREATAVLLTFNPAHRDHPLPDRVIAPDTGPELLTGSTRLKAGTATKLVLNILSTLAMVHSGKVIGNLMVDLNPSNVKLRDRAVRIVGELTGASEDAARTALEESSWVVRDACERLSKHE
jgi:N-acetylmuramic acid 6-phosphate etherase